MHRYASQCGELAQELVDSLSEQEVELLKSRLEGASKHDWKTWKLTYQADIAGYVAATPSQRQRKKRWQACRLELTLAAFQHCIEAQILLDQVDEHFLMPGGPYRAMASKAGVAYRKVAGVEATSWPWPGDTPFVDDDP